MDKIVNPFDLLGSKLTAESNAKPAEEAIESTSSSVCNEQHGICPKCHNSMATSRIPNSKMDNLVDVFWCDQCRVTTPKPKA